MANVRRLLLTCGLVAVLFTVPRAVSAQDPDAVRAGLEALGAGHLDSAADLFANAARAASTAGIAFYDLGIVRARQHRLSESAAAFAQAATLLPEGSRARAHYNLGVILAERGQLARALEEFANTLRIDPTDEKARTNLAITKARLARNRPRVTTSTPPDAVRRALERTPDQSFAFVNGRRSTRRQSPDRDW